jgi:hypothetical protein
MDGVASARFFCHNGLTLLGLSEEPMSETQTVDLTAAHKYFSAECFNRAWNYIDKTIRTPAEEEQMLLLAFASFYHWTQRPEQTAENRSIGLWQLSRVYALLGQADNARRYAEKCRAESDLPDLPPYCLGYAYEALARAEMVAGKKDKMQAYIFLAQKTAEKMADEEARDMLLNDLKMIK